MANSTEHIVYVFDEFRLDRDRLMLYRGETEVTLPPKAIETLAVLVENRGEIQSKGELIEAVWKDAFVEESNLSHYLYMLRKALGTRSDGTPYIETLRRRGYRFTAEVRTLTDPSVRISAFADHPIRSEGRTVERRGNVLALVDWKDPDLVEPIVQPEIVADSAHRSRRPQRWAWVLSISVAIILLGAISAAVYLLSRPGPAVQQEQAAVEQNILRLTNGIEVLDATISPDGKYFVYHEPDGKIYRIWLQQTGQSTRYEIVPASERLPLTKTFTPDGQYVYFLAADAVGEPASLYRVPTLGGPVTKIVSDMQSGVSFSPDGREMVYYRADREDANYVIRSSDGSGDERVLHRTTRGYGSAAWSPDGRSIAVVLQADRENIGGGCSMAVVRLETGSLIRFSDEVWENCARVEWSRDGRGLYMIGTRLGESMTTRRDQLFFVSYPQGKSRKMTSDGSRHRPMSLGVTNDGSVLTVPFNRSSQIWAIGSNGESRSSVQLTTGQADGRTGIAPLVGGRVAYIARTGENLNVWVMNQDGSDQKQITDNTHGMEEIRSGGDGRYLVFSGYMEYPRPHLFRMNIDGTGLRQITSGDTREIDSSLSNDGKWIVYDSTTDLANTTELLLWKQPIDGDGERISLNRNDCQMPHFSPDDKYISCVRQQQDILILSSTDGSLIKTIRVPQSATISHTLNFGARWTPDGKAVAYILNDKGVSNIWTHPIDGTAPKQLTDFSGGSIYHFAYSMDGKRLFVARGYQIRDAVLIREIVQ